MTDEEQKIHDLKYEVYTLRQRLDKIEQEHKEMQKAVAILILRDQQCQEVMGLLTNTVTSLTKEMKKDQEVIGLLTNTVTSLTKEKEKTK